MRDDLIIVGGGVVGALLAVAASRLGLRIALIDARLPRSDDPRLFGLNSTSCQMLDNLGVWRGIAQHASPIRQVHVSHKGYFGALRLNAEDVAMPALGHVMPAHYIEAALNQVLLASGVTLYRPATLIAMTQQPDQVNLSVETPEGKQKLAATVVIGADGTASTVRTLAGIEAKVHDYGQSAIVTRVRLRRSYRQIAYERFNKTGAIAMLPLADQACASIWTADNAMISALMAKEEAGFLEALQAEFGYRLGHLESISERHVFPLRMTQASQYCVGRVLLLGNAAHTIHPVAAQG